jgi:hypothetical protein
MCIGGKSFHHPTTAMTVPTVDDVLACTHVGGHFHDWRVDCSVIRVTRDELRPALEAAYDRNMPDWPAMVEIVDA